MNGAGGFNVVVEPYVEMAEAVFLLSVFCGGFAYGFFFYHAWPFFN